MARQRKPVKAWQRAYAALDALDVLFAVEYLTSLNRRFTFSRRLLR
jgi:hypothetical protein